MNAGIIVDAPMMDVRFKNGRKLGTVEEGFASTLVARRPLLLRRAQPRGRADQGQRHHRPRLVQVGADRHLRRAAHVDVDPPRRARPPLSCATATNGSASPTTSANGSRCRSAARSLPQPDELLVETFPHEGRHYMVRLQLRRLERAPVARHADHQADGERRAQAARLRRQRLCARLLRPRTDHRPRAPCSRPTSSSSEFVEWVEQSNLLKRAFREVAVIGGLVERHHPGQAQVGPPGQLLDRPHLRRAAPLRARPSAAHAPRGAMRARG